MTISASKMQSSRTMYKAVAAYDIPAAGSPVTASMRRSEQLACARDIVVGRHHPAHASMSLSRTHHESHTSLRHVRIALDRWECLCAHADHTSPPSLGMMSMLRYSIGHHSRNSLRSVPTSKMPSPNRLGLGGVGPHGSAELTHYQSEAPLYT